MQSLLILLPNARLEIFESGKLTARALLTLLPHSELRRITAGAPWQDVTRLFIFDACSDHLIKGKKSAGNALAFDGQWLLNDAHYTLKDVTPVVSHAPHSRNLTLLNSCDLGSNSLELTTQSHGLFTGTLLECLRNCKNQTRIAIDQPFVSRLANIMTNKARSSGLPNDLIHKPVLKGAPVELHLATTQNNRAIEQDTRQWRLACIDNTPEAYKAYINNAPENAAHIDADFAKLEALKEQAAQCAAEAAERQQQLEAEKAKQQADQAAWQTAQNTTGSIATQEAAYKHYLKTHPEGNYHQQANQKLSDLTRLRVQQEQEQAKKQAEEEQAQRQAAQRAAEAAERQKQLDAERAKKQAEQQQAQPATSTSANAPNPPANGKVIGAIAAVAVLGLATALFMRSPQPANQSPATQPAPKPTSKPATKPTPKPIDPSALLAQAKAAYQQKNTAVAVGSYIQWLQWAQHNSSDINPADFNTAIETISELLAKDLNNHKLSLDWAAQLQKYQGFPTNYWQGLLAYCHHTQPNLDQAKIYLSRVQHTSPKQASRDTIQIYSALAKLQLKRIAKKEPC